MKALPLAALGAALLLEGKAAWEFLADARGNPPLLPLLALHLAAALLAAMARDPVRPMFGLLSWKRLFARPSSSSTSKLPDRAITSWWRSLCACEPRTAFDGTS